MIRPFVIALVAALALDAATAADNEQACPLNPLTASAFASFRQKEEEGMRYAMQSINCYDGLLKGAIESVDPQLTANLVALGVPKGAYSQEEYSKFLEHLTLHNPQKLFEALLRVEERHVGDVLRLLRDPLVTDKKDIDASLERLNGTPRYAGLLARYKSHDGK
jgi:tRNA isopentenyl-2-thiomethyl-A-37 hydroxylase MiaE